MLALCGDLTDLGKPKEAEILAGDLRAACTIPVVGVLGNHDFECGQPDEVARVLRDAGVRFLGEQVCEIDGVGFAGVEGFAGGFEGRMLTPFGEEAIKRFVEEAVNEAMRLENALRRLAASTDRVVAVLHYAPVIDRFPAVRAVLHGHAHQGAYAATTPKGTPVYNCAGSVVEKETGRPYALIEV